MRRIKQSGRNQTDRAPGAEAPGLKIKTLPALREALKAAAQNGELPKVAAMADATAQDFKPFIKGAGTLPNGLRGRAVRALELL